MYLYYMCLHIRYTYTPLPWGGGIESLWDARCVCSCWTLQKIYMK